VAIATSSRQYSSARLLPAVLIRPELSALISYLKLGLIRSMLLMKAIITALVCLLPLTALAADRDAIVQKAARIIT
jgi:hypothetical protein